LKKTDCCGGGGGGGGGGVGFLGTFLLKSASGERTLGLELLYNFQKSPNHLKYKAYKAHEGSTNSLHSRFKSLNIHPSVLIFLFFNYFLNCCIYFFINIF
jgi:hypothetical protein